jgi:hypothetical protein
MNAISNRQTQVLLHLLDCGADVNVVTSSGTALSIAATTGSNFLVGLLLNGGADLQVAIIATHQSAPNLGRTAALKMLRRLHDSDKLAHLPQQSRSLHRTYDIRLLHVSFVQEYQRIVQVAQEHHLYDCRMAPELLSVRAAWASGIRTLQRLCRGKAPQSVGKTLILLCIVKAMSKTLDKNGRSNYEDQFTQDLHTWQSAFHDSLEDLELFRRGVKLMWNVNLENLDQSHKPARESVAYLNTLVTTLIRESSELFGHCGPGNDLRSSQARWVLRNHSQSLSSLRPDLPTAEGSSPRGSDNSATVLGALSSRSFKTVGKSTLRKDIESDDRIFDQNISNLMTLLASGIFAIALLFLSCKLYFYRQSSSFCKLIL